MTKRISESLKLAGITVIIGMVFSVIMDLVVFINNGGFQITLLNSGWQIILCIIILFLITFLYGYFVKYKKTI